VNEKIKEFRKEAFLYEIAVMKALPKSPYLINFIGYCEGPLSIIMKFYKTSLAEVNKILKPTPELFFKIAFDISLGMKLVHAAGIIHLDLKPRKYQDTHAESILTI
jgi:serine/threonine protein kinase